MKRKKNDKSKRCQNPVALTTITIRDIVGKVVKRIKLIMIPSLPKDSIKSIHLGFRNKPVAMSFDVYNLIIDKDKH